MTPVSPAATVDAAPTRPEPVVVGAPFAGIVNGLLLAVPIDAALVYAGVVVGRWVW